MSSVMVALLGWGVPLAVGDAVRWVAVVIVLGAVALVAVWVRFLKVRAITRSDDATSPAQLTNCGSCGARISVEAETCEYCGAALG